jgi:HEAT repeat protein
MVRHALALLGMFAVLCPQWLVSQDAPKSAQSSQPLATLTTPELLSRFESAEFDWQQAEIGCQLVSRGDLSVLPRIEELSRVDDRKRRSNAAFVLDGLGDQRGLEILIAEVRDTKLRAVKPGEGRGNNPAAHQVIADRYYAAQLLGHIGRDPAIPTLVELLKDEQLAYVAAISLGRLGVRAAIPDILEMADRFPRHRDEAATALAMLGDDRGLDMLVKSIETSEHYAVRCRAIDALRMSGSVKQQPALLKALEDPHANVRVCAARALQAVGDSQALPSLRKAATDKTVPPWHAPTTVSTEAIAAIEAIEGRSK